MTTTSTLDEALRLASLGYPVFPCHTIRNGKCSCGHDDCQSPGKHPRTANGLKDATTDCETIRQWWSRWPDSNIGMPTGQVSGIVAIDIDPRHGGDDTLANLLQTEGLLPTTPESVTGNRGRHILFAYPGWPVKCDNRGRRLGQGIDIKADGGYIIVAPSMGQQQPYRWMVRLGDAPLAPLPEWIADRLRDDPKPARAPSQGRLLSASSGAASAYVAAAMAGEVEAVRSAAEGTRNDTLNEAAFKLGGFVPEHLDEGAVESALLDAALAAGLPEREARATIHSGVIKGKASPRQIPEKQIGMSVPTATGTLGADSQDGRNTAGSLIERPDPIPLAEHYLAHGRNRRLIRWRGEFFEHTDTHYRPVTDEGIDAELYRHLDTMYTPNRRQGAGPDEIVKVVPKSSLVREVRLALPSRKRILLPDHVDEPCWMDGRTDLPAADLIGCRNGLLHLPTGRLFPSTDELFCLNAVGYDYDRDAPDPVTWLRFLDQLFGDDHESRDTLQDLAGYFLTGDTRQQKIALMVGPKRSGKGTIGRVLTALLGTANVCGPTLASLGMNFGLWPLLGKRLAIISDARLSGRSDQAVIAERLLSISGEDAITVDRKHLPPWTGKLQARFLILTNELPRLADASGALPGRFVMICLKHSWFGQEDPGLSDKLLEELPGILLWAIEGWRRLRARGHFIQPSASTEAMGEIEDLSSPIGAFLRDTCNIGPEYSCETTYLYAAWQSWCKANGRDHDGTVQTFGRDLRASVPGLGTRQPKVGGQRFREYTGVGLTATATAEFQTEASSPWAP